MLLEPKSTERVRGVFDKLGFTAFELSLMATNNPPKDLATFRTRYRLDADGKFHDMPAEVNVYRDIPSQLAFVAHKTMEQHAQTGEKTKNPDSEFEEMLGLMEVPFAYPNLQAPRSDSVFDYVKSVGHIVHCLLGSGEEPTQESATHLRKIVTGLEKQEYWKKGSATTAAEIRKYLRAFNEIVEMLPQEVKTKD